MAQPTALLIWFTVVAALGVLGMFEGEGLVAGMILGVPLFGILYALCRKLDPRRELQLGAILAVAVATRWALAAMIHILVYRQQPGLFSPDEVGYEEMARYLTAFLQGRMSSTAAGAATAPGLVWIMGTCYWVFGNGPLVPKMLNGLAGGWMAVSVALLAHHFYDASVGRRAGWLLVFWPSIVLWSALNTKDNWALACTTTALLAFVQLRDRFRLWLLGLVALFLLFVAAFRPYEVAFLAVGIAGSFLFAEKRRLGGTLGAFVLVTLVLALIVRQTEAFKLGGSGDDAPTMEVLNGIRLNYSDEVGSAVDMSLVDTSTPAGLVLWLPIGVSYFLFAPVPLTGKTIIARACSPEMLAWYFLMPSMYRGLRGAVRNQLSRIAPVLLFVIASTLGWSMLVTNVGSLFRYRAQVSFLPLIAAAADQVNRGRAALERRRNLAVFNRAAPSLKSSLGREA